jgi:hypothetical protein
LVRSSNWYPLVPPASDTLITALCRDESTTTPPVVAEPPVNFTVPVPALVSVALGVEPAIGLYRALGFTVTRIDRAYGRDVP